MSWVYLIIAGMFEAAFAGCLAKLKEPGANVPLWVTGFFVCLGISMYLLYKATQVLPIGTAYAVWTGIGAVGTVTLGIIFFKEPVDFWRMFFLSLLVISIVGLKWATN